MLYALAHFLRDKTPWVWDLVNWINSLLFSIRYGQKLKTIEKSLHQERNESLKIVRLSDVPTEDMVHFFQQQPEEAFRFFKPHGFTADAIRKLQRNKAFLGYVLLEKESGHIAGYCFNRSFFFGKGFRGRIVDINHRGQGLGTCMNKILNEVGFGIGLRLFETVSKDNIASYRSALSASNVRVVKELEDNDLYLEILPN